MLTDSEWEWLNDREIFLAGLGCYVWDGYYWDEGSPFEDMKEAAEFEARVVAKLAGITESMMKTIQKDNITYPCYACPANENCAGFECREALLRYARLAVEEEMNADR